MRDRINYIDAIRGSVMLMLVPYHGMRFLQNRGEDMVGLDPAIFWLHLWRMGLFFAVSGFLAAMTLKLWGPSRQVRQRLVRIGIPLAVAVVTILPLMKVIVLGYVNRRTPDHSNPVYEWTLANIFDWKPHHLWFLSYVLALNLAALLVWAVVRRWPTLRVAIEAGFRRLAAGVFLVPALALICASILWIEGYVQPPGIVAISFVPQALPLAYYAVFFAFGWMLYRARDLLPRIESRPGSKMLAGAAFAAAAWLVLDGYVSVPGFLSGWAVAFSAGLATWFTLFGVWGLFARLLPDARPWVRYLADAAYWIYLIHLPFLLFFEIGLTTTSLSPWVRLTIATGAALALSLLTYTLLIRHSPIGRLLHGPRERRSRRGRTDPVPVS